MKALRSTTQFKADLRLHKKRGKDIEKFNNILEELLYGRTLSGKCHDHPLLGQYRGSRECHIEPDWILIYEITPDEVILIRTGSHADLFK